MDVDQPERFCFVEGSVTIIGPDQLRVTSPGQVISYAVTRDPNVGQLQLAKNNQVLNVSSSSRHKFTQRDIDNGESSINWIFSVSVIMTLVQWLLLMLKPG